MRIHRPSSNSQGVIPVVAWGVTLCVARVLLILERKWFLFDPAACTACSASPFDMILFALRNVSNSDPTKHVPLWSQATQTEQNALGTLQ